MNKSQIQSEIYALEEADFIDKKRVNELKKMLEECE